MAGLAIITVATGILLKAVFAGAELSSIVLKCSTSGLAAG